MKYIKLLLLSLVLILGACSNTQEEGTKNKTEPVQEENKEKIPEESKEPEVEEIDYSSLPQFEPISEEDTVVTMNTNKGDIKIKLFPDYTPKTVNNFIKLSEKGYYDGLTFHRVIKDFMIQGGDPEGNGSGGGSIYGKPFKDEFSPLLMNFRGALSMANSGPNTNGSQFFIVQKSSVEDEILKQMLDAGYPEEVVNKYEEYGGTPWLDFKHTVFGQVVEGMDIIDSITEVEVNEMNKPLEDIIIETITVE